MSTEGDGAAETFDRLTKQVARGGGIVAIGSVIGKICNFALQLLLGRVLGTGAYGLYALGFSVTSIASSISSLGLQNGIVRFVSIYRGEGDKARIKGTLVLALTISLISSIIVAGLLFVFSRPISIRIFNKPDLVSVLRIFALSLPFYVLMTMTSFSARAFLKMGHAVVITAVSRPITNILLVGLAFLLGFRLRGAIYGFLASCILSALLGLYFLYRIFPEISTSLQYKPETRKLLLFSLPVLISGIATAFLFQVDRLMLGWLGTSSEVGIYNAAATISVQMGVITQALSTISSPMIADLHNRGRKKELKHVFQTTTRWGFISSIPLFLVFVLFSNNLMLLFGPAFSRGAFALVLLSSATFIMAVRGPTVALLIMSGKQKLELLNTLALMSLNIVLNFWFIRLWGLIGAAIATATSIGLLSIVRLLEVKSLLGMQPYNHKYIKPLLSGVIVLLIYLFVHLAHLDSGTGLMWMIYAGILLLVYGGLVCAFGLEKEDVAIMAAIKRKLFNGKKIVKTR